MMTHRHICVQLECNSLNIYLYWVDKSFKLKLQENMKYTFYDQHTSFHKF